MDKYTHVPQNLSEWTRIADKLNFKSNVISKEELLELLMTLGMAECEALDYMQRNLYIFVIYRPITDNETAEIYISNMASNGIFSDELCIFERDNIEDMSSWRIKMSNQAESRYTRSMFLHKYYYSLGQYPRIGDILYVPDIFSRLVIVDNYGDTYRLSPVGAEDIQPLPSLENSVTGYRWKTSNLVFSVTMDIANTRLNVNENWYDYMVCDYLINPEFPKHD